MAVRGGTRCCCRPLRGSCACTAPGWAGAEPRPSGSGASKDLAFRRKIFIANSLNHFLYFGLQLRHLQGKLIDFVAFRVGQVAVSQRFEFVGFIHHAAGNTDHGSVIRHGMHHYAARADLHMMADADVAQDRRARADHHSVSDGGVPFTGILAGTAQRHTLIDQHVVADLAGLPDDHAHAMIDEEATPNGGAGVDLNAGQAARKLRNGACQREPTAPVKAVRDAMEQHGVEPWITQHDLEHGARGGVAPEDGIDLFANVAEHSVRGALHGVFPLAPKSIIACIMLVTMRFTVIFAAAFLAGCSSSTSTAPQAKQLTTPQAVTSVISLKHPLGKYLELSGFRIGEKGAGKLDIRFAVINHSQADIGELVMHVKLTTTAAKPEDPPITEFDAKVPPLGPLEVKDASGSATTKLRVYEMPDWQFIKAEAEITSPAP